MKNYMLLYHMVDPNHVTSEGAGDTWMKWFETLGDKVVSGGNPFAREQAQIMDQKVEMETKTAFGYSIVKADSLEDAVKMAMTCPMATGDDSWVEVYETMPM